ncbi:hypothetical protein SAMN05660745_02608 [Corynebacterium glucuronolyticum]|nr:hypothetical protein CGLUCO_09050 [Corynebacterium glucuronolyticum DSM 44120]SMB82284.1 hypothetical protein SAMN05660745_02608 [Corynebacterium glucuronolyticum]
MTNPPVVPYVAIAMKLGDHPVFDLLKHIVMLLERI